MATVLFRGIVKAGRFRPDDVVKYQGRLAKLEGRRVIESIKREQHGRTMNQNSYLWGVVYATLSEWSGHEPDELHEYLKEKFLQANQRKLPSGEVMMVPPSTTTLTVEEFGAYVDKVVRWAADHGVFVPAPGDVTS